jgi:hypothetical protein
MTGDPFWAVVGAVLVALALVIWLLPAQRRL